MHSSSLAWNYEKVRNSVIGFAPSHFTLIHATPLSIEPINAAFTASRPDAERVHLLDDSLSRNRAKTKDLADDIFRRFGILGDYAAGISSDAILFACSRSAKRSNGCRKS